MYLRSSCSILLLCFILSGALLAQAPTPNVPPVLLRMIRDSAIQDDLNLDDAQRQQVATALKSVDGGWFRSRNIPADEQAAEISRLTSELQTSLTSILTPAQLERLKQLQRQALGTRMLTRRDVADAMNISDATRTKINEAFVETDRLSAQYQQQLQKGELKANEVQRNLAKLQKEEQAAVLRYLSAEQRSKIGGLTGKAFDFSKVKRTLPLAPEITNQGVSWIQGGPQKLDDLKGKVVAVHYYAFQCINCRRNLPHYNGWHQDYADKGLVVIGIQTPETSSERNLNLVTEAAKKEGIEYPVLLDSESANWKTWNNTMWPTVYLIDKKGFLRRWWQGEMNWQGTMGEQDMRKTIEQLLAEDASN